MDAKVTQFRAHWHCINKDSRRWWVGPSAALCTVLRTVCAQTVAPQNGCMHEPCDVATVLVKRKSNSAHSVTIMFISGHRHVYFGYPKSS